MDFHNYLEKLRALPDQQKKAIMWAVVAVIAVLLGIVWFNMSAKRVFQIQEELTKIEMPQIESNTSK